MLRIATSLGASPGVKFQTGVRPGRHIARRTPQTSPALVVYASSGNENGDESDNEPAAADESSPTQSKASVRTCSSRFAHKTHTTRTQRAHNAHNAHKTHALTHTPTRSSLAGFLRPPSAFAHPAAARAGEDRGLQSDRAGSPVAPGVQHGGGGGRRKPQAGRSQPNLDGTSLP